MKLRAREMSRVGLLLLSAALVCMSVFSVGGIVSLRERVARLETGAVADVAPAPPDGATLRVSRVDILGDGGEVLATIDRRGVRYSRGLRLFSDGLVHVKQIEVGSPGAGDLSIQPSGIKFNDRALISMPSQSMLRIGRPADPPNRTGATGMFLMEEALVIRDGNGEEILTLPQR
jgi:hypothetical protein